MIRKTVLAIALAVASLIGLGVNPAAAVQTGSCSIGGYTYNSSIDFNRPGGGNVVFNWWNLTASSGGWPMEYRVRWYAPDLTTVIYDTQYVSWRNNSTAGDNPGISRYFPGRTSFVLVNGGKSGDGFPTCEKWYDVPGA